MEGTKLWIIINNEFICYLLEYVRKIGFDSAQKELQARLKENNTEEMQRLLDQVVLHQENSAGDLNELKNSIINDFTDFCNWYFAGLEKDAERIYLESNKETDSPES